VGEHLPAWQRAVLAVDDGVARVAIQRRAGPVIVALGLTGFLLFGMRDGALGVAWPSIRASFGQPLSALGLLLVSSLVGYLVASTASGRLSLRIPVGRQLILASCAASLGVSSFAFSTHWLLLVAGSCLLGVANGTVDVNVNAYLALRHGVRTLNLVHAGWGVGTALGPLAVTASLALNGSWRAAYVVLLGFEVLLLGGFVLTRRLWDASRVAPPRDRHGAAPSSPAAHTTLAGTLALFSVYAGLELGTGQWAFTFLAGGHGVATTPAGLAVAAYWGALTAGRVVASRFGNRLRPTTLLDLCLGITTVGFVVVLAYPGALLAGCGLVIAGAGLGPIFPTLVSLTPHRVGPERTSTVMGYQLSSAALGGSVISAVIGVALQQFGARALGVIVVVGVGVLIALRGITRGSEGT
jgi:fucose permease